MRLSKICSNFNKSVLIKNYQNIYSHKRIFKLFLVNLLAKFHFYEKIKEKTWNIFKII